MRLPILRTERLILREISILDAEDMFEYATDPAIGPMAGWIPHQTIEDSIRVISLFHETKKRGEPGVYAIVEKNTQKMIGTIELFNYVPNYKAELGYALSQKYWGKGLVPEAARAVLSFGFNQLRLKRIEVSAFTNNYQSIRVIEKLGFLREGIARNGYLRYDGRLFNKVIYGMTDKDYYHNI